MRRVHWSTPLEYAAREMPGGYTVPLRYEEWLAYQWHLRNNSDTISPNEDDMPGVAPHRVQQLEMNMARVERDKAMAQLQAAQLQMQQLHQQANAAIQQLVAQVNQLNLFIAAAAHSQGGKLQVPHASLDVLRAEKHTMSEKIDDDLKVTIVEIAKAVEEKTEETPTPAEAATDVTDESINQPAASLIEVVPR